MPIPRRSWLIIPAHDDDRIREAAARHSSDGYAALGCLPAERRERGKGSELNRNEGLRAKSRTRLNRLGRATSGCSKRLETLAGSLAPAWLRKDLI